MMTKARNAVYDWYRENGVHDIKPDDIYIVWFSKTLQNWKALVSTTIPDGRYFELTYNGDKKELYLDSYIKEDNKVIKDR